MENINKELCVLIPAYNEEEVIESTVYNIVSVLESHEIPFNLLVIDDHSTDKTLLKVKDLVLEDTRISIVKNENQGGVGNAIRFGLKFWKGDAVVIVMADASDSPLDIVQYYETYIRSSSLCVFGSRFIEGGRVIDYPRLKYIFNRIFNFLVNIKIRKSYYDYTNAFKLYDRSLIDNMPPLQSSNFSIFLELSLNAFKVVENIPVVPISWENRKKGKSKLNLYKNARAYFKVLFKS